jgi:hypothetical protein
MDFAGHVLERVQILADSQTKVVLEFCKLEITTLAKSQVPRVRSSASLSDGLVLRICCPNRFSAEQLEPRIIGVFGQSIHPLGIEQVVISDGEGFEALYIWHEGGFSFTIPGLDPAALDFE